MKLSFLHPREKFLILEITPKGANGLFVNVDEERKLSIEKLEKGINLKKFLKSPAQRLSQKAWEGEHLFKTRRKVIAIADPLLATTIPIPFKLTRESDATENEITVSEIENLIAQAMGKMFHQCRSEAARRLAIHEIDTILVGAKAKHFTVDGNSVVNPAGFTGKKIGVLLELTFTGRMLFEDLKEFFNSPEEFYFAEAPQASLSSMSRARALPLGLIVADDTKTSVYIFEKAKDEYPVLYRETLAWEFGDLFSAIVDALAVHPKVARDLYRSYLRGDMSESALRAFKKIIDPVIEEFFQEIDKGKVKGNVYLDAPETFPFELPHRRAGATFDHIPLGETLGKLGFAAHDDIERSKEGVPVLARHLFPFLEAYFDKTNSDINQKLRRRLHWLA